MIIAAIGSYNYQLESQQDAEVLLRILSRATEIERDYIGRNVYCSECEHPTEVSVAICTRQLLSQTELEKVREQEKNSTQRAQNKQSSTGLDK